LLLSTKSWDPPQALPTSQGYTLPPPEGTCDIGVQCPGLFDTI
jgi:hypothetical protein